MPSARCRMCRKSTLHIRRRTTAERSLSLRSNGERWLCRLNTWSNITQVTKVERVAPTEMGPAGALVAKAARGLASWGCLGHKSLREDKAHCGSPQCALPPAPAFLGREQRGIGANRRRLIRAASGCGRSVDHVTLPSVESIERADDQVERCACRAADSWPLGLSEAGPPARRTRTWGNYHPLRLGTTTLWTFACASPSSAQALIRAESRSTLA